MTFAGLKPRLKAVATGPMALMTYNCLISAISDSANEVNLNTLKFMRNNYKIRLTSYVA